MSKKALNSISRGWFWEAVLGKQFELSKYCVQCTTWKDRKQVMFLHTSSVGSSRGKHTVRRDKKGKHGRDILPAPLFQLDYALNFAAVDRNDRDSADYATSLRTNRWYLRVMFWLFDLVIHTCYVILLCVKAKNGEGPKEWQVYLKKDGRFKFQIDLGFALHNHAISSAWTNLDGQRPDWIRQASFLPCDCEKCFFCLNKLTNGIGHLKKRKAVTIFVQHNGTRN